MRTSIQQNIHDRFWFYFVYRTGILSPTRSESCEMTQRQSGNSAGLKHQAAGGRHQVPLILTRAALKTRKEPMIGIWRWPALNFKSAIRLGQRTTTSMPNIISDRCPRTQGRLKNRACAEELCVSARAIAFRHQMNPGRPSVRSRSESIGQLTHSAESLTISSRFGSISLPIGAAAN